MTSNATLDDLKQRGADTPAPDELRALYSLAFKDCGLRALWSSKPADKPSIADLLAITESLRVEGGVSGRRLAEQIISLSRAALDSTAASAHPTKLTEIAPSVARRPQGLTVR